MESETVYKLSHDDLANVVEKLAETSALNKFHDRMVTGKTVADIHGLSEKTIGRYIEDGILTPISGVKKYQFRLSEVLRMDFSTIKHKRR